MKARLVDTLDFPTKMCCLCKPLQWIGTVLVLALVFVLGGYAGKALYTESTVNDMVSQDFWRPDAPFWVAGILSVLFVAVVFSLIYVLCVGLRKILCCECCESSEEPARARYRELEAL